MKEKHIKLLQIAQARGREPRMLGYATDSLADIHQLKKTDSIISSSANIGDTGMSLTTYLARRSRSNTAKQLSNKLGERAVSKGTAQPLGNTEEIRLEVETIERMSPASNTLFVFIRDHLMDCEHPLNKIAASFVYHYVDHYSREILANCDKFLCTAEQDYEIAQSSVITSHAQIQA